MQDSREEELQFVEEVGLVFEETGLPRMAGRILGWLIMADPYYPSAEQLAEGLMASKGSISTMTRSLIQMGLIEKFRQPGMRHDSFRLRPEVGRRIIKHGLEDEIRMFHQLAEHGLRLKADQESLGRRWLEEIHSVYSFLEKEYPTLLERWHHEYFKHRPPAAPLK